MCRGTPPTSRPTGKALVWDLPTRLFHWLLAILVVIAFVSVKIGGSAMVWHGRCGLAILGLLVFRIIWGFVGPTYARFAHFVRGPGAIRAYLRGEWNAHGHNPIGALSVLALLGVLGLQAVTGLFANDDIAYMGHLYPLVDNELSGRITGIHRLLEQALILLVALHIGAIAFYLRIKKHNLVKPMLTGWADGKPSESARGGSAVAFIVAALIAAAAVWAASGALLSPPPPTTEAPAF